MWSKRKNADATHRELAGSLKFAVTGMHCGNCPLTIDEALEDISGVARAHTSFRSGSTEITLAEGASPEQVAREVLGAIAAAGYTATVVDI